MPDAGAYLVIRSFAPDIKFREFRDVVAKTFEICGEARLHEVEVLEPGSIAAHTLILPFSDAHAARDAFGAMPVGLIAAPSEPLVLLTGAVPAGGFDDPAIPTKANVLDADVDEPVLLLIEGSASDQEKMDRYREIILPLMFDLRAYYMVFDLGGAVEVLSGKWDEAIFAISRWPTRAAARAFWLGDEYQKNGIPLRLDIGRFEVVAVPQTNG